MLLHRPVLGSLLTLGTGLAMAGLAPPAMAAHLSATWLGGTGDWSDPTEWSTDPDFPNDGGGDTYDATINSGTATLDTDISLQAFTQSNGNVDGASDLTIDGLFTWTGNGDQRGTGTTFANAGLEFVTNVSRDLDGRSLVVAGTANHRASTLFFKNGATLTNTGTWISDSDAGAGGSGTTLGLSRSGAGTMTFANQGTFQQSGSQRTNLSTVFENTGAVEVSGGELSLSGGGNSTSGSWTIGGDGELFFNGGTHTLDAGSSISGGGTVVFDAGTVDHQGSYAVTGTTRTLGGIGVLGAGGSTGTLELIDGKLEVAGGTLTVTDSLLWTSDDLSGAGNTVVEGDAELNGGTKFLDGHDLTLEGTTNHRGGSLFVRNSATITNTGTWISDSDPGAGGSDTTVSLSSTGAGTKRFDNQGTFRQAGDQRTNVSIALDNSGDVEVQDGELSLSGNGTSTGGSWSVSGNGALLWNGSYSLDATSAVSGDGDVVFDAGTVDHAGSFAITGTTRVVNGNGAGILRAGGSTHTLELVDGELEIAGGTFTVTDAMLWTSDRLSGAGNTVVEGDADLSGSSRFLGGHDLTLEGTTTHSAGALFFEGSATLTNAGTWISDGGGSPSTLSLANTGSGTKRFDNQGTLLQQGTQRTNVSPGFTNSGTIDVEAGTLAFFGGFTQTAGDTRLDGGELESSSALDFQAGTLGGNGLVDADILMSGTLAAGNSAGQIDVDGALTLLSAALFQVELGGTTQGSEYDFVDVTGNVTLGGQLELTLIDGFLSTISVSDTFTVLAAGGTLGGSFANIASGDRLSTAGGHSFQVDYGAASPFGSNALVLSAFAPVPEPGSALLVGVGLAWLGARRAPGRGTR